MKTRMITITLLIALFHGVFAQRVRAQGTVDFGNTSQLLTTNGNVIGQGLGLIQPGQFVFGLYFGSTFQQALSSVTPVLVVTNMGFAGFITTSTFTLQGYNTGDTYFFQVRGWLASTGAKTYEDALPLTYYRGVSSIGQVTLGGGTVAAGKIFFVSQGSTPNGVPAFQMFYIPEPSTLCLCGAGLVSLIVGCKRKRCR